MKFVSLSESLKRAVAIAERMSGKSIQLPILSCILCETEKNRMKISATNLEQAITTYVLGKTEQEGKSAVPAKMFSQILSAIREEKIILEASAGALSIKTESQEINLQGMDAEGFPVIPKIEAKAEAELPSAAMSQALFSVAPAMAQESIRPELQGVFFAFSRYEGLRFAATDSFRLAEKKISGDETAMKGQEQEFSCIVPSRAVYEVAKIAADLGGTLKIAFDRNQIGFSWENAEFTSRLLEGAFPKYEGLVPSAFETELRLNKRRFSETLRLAGLCSSRLNDIKLTIDERKKIVSVLARDASKGTYEGEVSGSVSGKSLTISFNWRFLLEGLENLKGEEAYLGLNRENAPALLKDERDSSYRYIVMPIRV